MLFQLPPNFKKDLARLGGLLDQFPAGLRCAMEFRHESWFADDVYERLRAANAALCVADTEEDTTPVEATADWGYLRLRDHSRWLFQNLTLGWSERMHRKALGQGAEGAGYGVRTGSEVQAGSGASKRERRVLPMNPAFSLPRL